MFVLPVQIDELAAEVAERGRGGERVVDERAAAPLGGNLASDDDFAAVSAIEHGLDGGRRFSGADKVGAGAAADEQVDGFDENGLAGSGFTGEKVESGLELDLEPIDHGEVSDSQKPQHVETGTPMVSDL